MSTANFYILAKPLQSDQGLKEQNRVGTRQLPAARAEAETKPEERLWKVCAEAASPRLGGLEWIAFLLFAVLALGALAYCFSELFHLLNSGALDETAGTSPSEGTVVTLESGLNPLGVTIGWYFDANGAAHGYVRARSGAITSFDPNPLTIARRQVRLLNEHN